MTTNMNEMNMRELDMNELEQANGGCFGCIVVLGIVFVGGVGLGIMGYQSAKNGK